MLRNQCLSHPSACLISPYSPGLSLSCRVSFTLTSTIPELDYPVSPTATSQSISQANASELGFRTRTNSPPSPPSGFDWELPAFCSPPGGQGFCPRLLVSVTQTRWQEHACGSLNVFSCCPGIRLMTGSKSGRRDSTSCSAPGWSRPVIRR
ncbi:hypothetical protein B0J18DRAFT_91464 [Chaetomium sp. MPI-SDFR-AT-0129]|nr:hypothetical protein B0J18DRAFT_91464 [Chaetomium sp. MPI-SDFR-AT-0129]